MAADLAADSADMAADLAADSADMAADLAADSADAADMAAAVAADTADMAAGRFYLAQDAGVDIKDVWQILFVDPIQRFIDPQFGDVPGVDGLAKCLRRHANGAGDEKRRMIVFVTSSMKYPGMMPRPIASLSHFPRPVP